MSDPSLSDIDFKNKIAWVWTTLNDFELDMTFVAWNKLIILGVSDFANEEEVFIEHLLIFNNVDSYLIPVSRKVA